MTPDLAHRRSLLTAALGFALLDTRGQPAPPEVQTVRRWLDNWTGLGDVVTGMQRQDYDLELARSGSRSIMGIMISRPTSWPPGSSKGARHVGPPPIGKMIQTARLNKEWTQTDLAARVGVRPEAVCRWERGRSWPSSHSRAAVAAVLGADLLTASRWLRPRSVSAARSTRLAAVSRRIAKALRRLVILIGIGMALTPSI